MNPRIYTVMTSRNLDADVEALLTGQGQQPVVDGPIMWIDHRPELPELPADVRVAPVTDANVRNGFCDVVGRAFSELGEDPSTWALAYPDVDSLYGDDRLALVAWSEDHPMAGGMVYLDGDVAQVIHVGTDPQRQGRGLGTLITAALTTAAFERGATLVALVATPPSEPVYRRLGYT